MASERPSPTSTEVATWRSFITAYSRVTAILERELLAERDMPLSWYDVLVVLQEAADKRLRMHDLAEQVLLSRAGLTRLIDRMTAAGLVERVPCAEDRRGTWVRITPAGQEANLSAASVHLAGVHEHFTGRLNATEMAGLKATCDRVLEGLGWDTAAGSRTH